MDVGYKSRYTGYNDTITFLPLGGANESSAASFLLKFGDISILIDCGVRLKSENKFPDFGYLERYLSSWKKISAIMITHAHMDHCGALAPVVQNIDPSLIYMTNATKEILKKVIYQQLQFEGEEAVDEEWKDMSKNFKTKLIQQSIDKFSLLVEYKPILIYNSEETDYVEIIPVPSGHILGSLGFIFTYRNKKIFFTGDYQPFQQYSVGIEPYIPKSRYDAIIMDATNFYQHGTEKELSRQEQERFILAKVEKAIKEKEVVLFPVQATGHALELLKILDNAMLQNLIPLCEIIVDGYVSVILDLYKKEYEQRNLYTFSSNILKRERDTPLEKILEKPTIIITTSKNFLKGNSTAYKYLKIIYENNISHLIMSLFVPKITENDKTYSFDFKKLNICEYRLDTHISARGIFEIIQTTRPSKLILVHSKSKSEISSIFRDIHPLSFPEETSVFHSINTMRINI